MRLFHTPPVRAERPTATSTAETRLHGRWLLLARLLWLAVAFVTVAFLVASVPMALDLWQRFCPGGPCETAQLSAVQAQQLQASGVSLSAWATFWVVESVLFALGWMGMGAIIFWRRSDDWLALMFAGSLVTLGAGLSRTLESMSVAAPGWLWPVSIVQFLGNVTFIGFLCLFPTGRIAPRWTLLVAALFLLYSASIAFFRFTPLDPLYWPQPYWSLAWLLANGSVVLVVLARYRSFMTPVQRQQAKWALAGAMIGDLGYTGLVFVFPLLPDGVWNILPFWTEGVVEDLVLLIVPLSFGMAILRSHLWDIDLFIKRSLVYGLLTATIIGLYGLVVGALGALFAHQDNVAISLFATGLVAVLFQPLRERLQRGVNRLLYGQRDEPYQVLARLGRQLEATLVPEAVLPTIVKTIAPALRLPYLAVSLRQGEEFSLAAVSGTLVGTPLCQPLAYQGEVIGQLQLIPRYQGEPLTPPDQRLLEDLTPQIGLAAHAVRLNADLQRSRERLVTAREEERRRLRRDLHDGIGPTLASLAQRLDTVSRLVPHAPEAAVTELGQLKTQVKTTIAEIRRLVYALRPPVLDELGLLSALREHLAQLEAPDGLHLALEAPEALPELSAAVEVAVYRIVLEALTNVVRHAHANTCLVKLDLGEAGELCLAITDDGIGLPATLQAGVGLTSMRERAAELGGTCQLTARSPQGTRVDVRLPPGKE
jgi:signal transduction histidine kinase